MQIIVHSNQIKMSNNDETVLEEKKGKKKISKENARIIGYIVLAILIFLFFWWGWEKVFPNKSETHSEAPKTEVSAEETTVEKKTDSSSPDNKQGETQTLDIDPDDIIETPLGEAIQDQAKNASKTTRTVTPNGDGTYTETIVFE